MGGNGDQERISVQLVGLDSHLFLEALTDNFANPKSIGIILEFVSRPSIHQILLDWSQDSVHAKMLLELANIANANREELAKVYVFRTNKKAKDLLDELESQYVVALLATRPWPSKLANLTITDRRFTDEILVESIEKLKLLVLIQSMVAAEQGWRKEHGLAETARFIRLCIDKIDNVRATLLHDIASTARRLPVFVSDLQHKVQAKSENDRLTNSQSNQNFLHTFLKVLNQRWIPFRKFVNSGIETNEQDPITLKLKAIRQGRISGHWGLSLDPASNRTNGSAASIQDQDDLAVDDDGSGGPSKPFVVGQKAIFQKLEMSLMLPFSWHRPIDHERIAFEEKLAIAQDGDPRSRLGSAITSLAILLARNLNAATLIRIAQLPQTDWTLDLQHGLLLRNPPRIEAGWAAPFEAISEGWLNPQAQAWSLKLNDGLTTALQKAYRRHTKCETLGQLWSKVSPDLELDEWFRDFVSTDSDLERLSTAMIAEYLPMKLHATTSDQATIAIISSNPRTVLSARCTYIAQSAGLVKSIWDKASVGTQLSITVADESNPQPLELNAAGSQLLVDLKKIRNALQITGMLLQSIPSNMDEWITIHNTFTGIMVLAILASTGGRPVNSPFQAIEDFDFNNKYVFVSDKQGGRGHNDRICIIASRVLEWMESIYLPYLLDIAQQIELASESNHAFSTAIRNTACKETQNKDKAIPLFFFLKSAREGIDWHEVTEESLKEALALEWPLPMNVFRHIFSTYLSNSTLSHDIRDALMGHADRYAEPHGDYSMRIPSDDFDEARPFVDALFDLIFDKNWTPEAPLLTGNWTMGIFSPSLIRVFGRKARDVNRIETQEAARTAAREELEALTKDANLKLWSSAQWYELGSKMLTRYDGAPHSAGWLRYQVFEEFVRNSWKELGPLNRSHRALIRLPATKSYFNASVADTDTRLIDLATSFNVWTGRIHNPNTTPLLSACIVAIALILEHHLTSFALIKRVIFEPHAVKSIWYDKSYWLEWTVNPEEKWTTKRPVFRLQVSQKIIKFLNAARQSGGGVKKWPKPPMKLEAWIKESELKSETGTSLETLISTLAKWAEQRNNLRMPGAYSAYLAQRQLSCSLPHDFWVRSNGESPLSTSPTGSEAEVSEPLSALDAFRESLSANSDSSTEAIADSIYYSHAESLFAAVKQAIQTKDLDRSGRQSKILTLIKTTQLPKGNAARELGKYALHLATRSKIRGSGTLNSATIERDWYNLEKGFLEFASNINMMGMDEDDVTTMYTGVVASSGNREFDEDDPRNQDARRRASREIQLFHEFCATKLGIPDPEWSEFCEPASWVNIRPGTVSLMDIGRTLTLLINKTQPADLTSTALRAALSHILCSRFGLRVGEAIGLQRRDIYFKEKVVVLFIRPNNIRPIKTDNSKRSVPLIESLSDAEWGVLKEALMRWERRAIRDTHHALFDNVNADNFKSIRSRTSGLITDALRIATGVPSTITHHLRHAFAMRVMALITDRSLTSAGTLSPNETRHLRKLLLGHDVSDKRNLWAIARLLGHASPGVTVLSYTHTLATWITQSNPTTQRYSDKEQIVDINLELLPRSTEMDIEEGILPEVTSVSFHTRFVKFLTFCRNVGSTLETDKATERAGIRYSERVYFEEYFKKLVSRIQPDLEDDEYAARKTLLKISVAAWERLFKFGDTFHQKSKLQFSEWQLLLNNRSEFVIYTKEHLIYLNDFLNNFDSSEIKFKLIYHPESSAKFISSIQNGSLPSSSTTEEVPRRRIDRHSLPNGVIYKDRAVLTPLNSSMTRLELCLMWFLFNIA